MFGVSAVKACCFTVGSSKVFAFGGWSLGSSTHQDTSCVESVFCKTVATTDLHLFIIQAVSQKLCLLLRMEINQKMKFSNLIRKEPRPCPFIHQAPLVLVFSGGVCRINRSEQFHDILAGSQDYIQQGANVYANRKGNSSISFLPPKKFQVFSSPVSPNKNSLFSHTFLQAVLWPSSLITD